MELDEKLEWIELRIQIFLRIMHFRYVICFLYEKYSCSLFTDRAPIESKHIQTGTDLQKIKTNSLVQYNCQSLLCFYL